MRREYDFESETKNKSESTGVEAESEGRVNVMRALLNKIKIFAVLAAFLGASAAGLSALIINPVMAQEINDVRIADAKTSVSTSRPLQKISLDKTNVTLNRGTVTPISVNYSPVNTTDNKRVTWSSSDRSVADVMAGKIVGKKAGTVTITARVGSKTASCKVTVKAPLKSIALSKTNITLKAGASQTLSTTFTPNNTTDSKTVTWTSSNTSVATVSGGKITAKKAGTAVITAKASGKTATCKVTVQAASTSGSTSSKETYKNVNEAYTLTNQFRTAKANQWYWNPGNKTKTYTYGLKSLTRDLALENVAKQRAKEQWTQYYVNGKSGHTRPNGKSWITAYPASVKALAENLSFGRTTCRDVILTGWAETNKKYDDQGHRRNMLNPMAKRVGIACYEKDGKTCWAMSIGY